MIRPSIFDFVSMFLLRGVSGLLITTTGPIRQHPLYVLLQRLRRNLEKKLLQLNLKMTE